MFPPHSDLKEEGQVVKDMDLEKIENYLLDFVTNSNKNPFPVPQHWPKFKPLP